MLKRLFRKRNIPILVLNAVPLYGAIFLHWDALSIILVYVAETILVGAIHMVKMTALYFMNRNNPKALAVERHNSGVTGAGLIPFFLIHFGFFVVIQMVVFSGFSRGLNVSEAIQKLLSSNFKYALAAIFITKITVLIGELFWDPEAETKLPDDVFFEPYPRIFVQQFMVILGGFFSIFNGSFMAYALVLIAIKTIVDILVANVSLKTIERWNAQYEKKEKSIK
jgi:hypothetical protein